MSNVGRIARIPQTIRSLQRFRDIVSVIAKYGFEGVVLQLGVEGYVDQARRLLRMKLAQPDGRQRYTVEQRVRMVLEELGPTFIKFGQILATRPDLLPIGVIEELRKLQDDVPAFSQSDARRIVETELGAPIDTLFASFEDKPIAAASIGQVHNAVLPGGDRVVIKVQRPSLDRIIETDLDILRILAELVDENVPEAKQYNPTGLVDQFARSIAQETDFTREAFHITKFGDNFADVPYVYCPAVYTELSTRRVLTMERISGAKASDMAAIDALGCDRETLASRGTQSVLKMIFEDGFFHADPHPGNIFILPENVICFIDYGQMGYVDSERIDELLVFLVGLLTGDMDRVVGLFQRLGLIDDSVDVRALKNETGEILDRYRSVALGDLDVARFISDVFETIQRHHVALPADLLMMGKAIATMEGIAQELFPAYDPFEEMRSVLLGIYVDRLTDPGYLLKGLYTTFDDYLYLLRTLPKDAQNVLAKLRKGELVVRVADTDASTAAANQAVAVNRLAASVGLAGLALCSTLLLLEPIGPSVAGVPLTTALGSIGIATAIGFGALLGALSLRSSLD